MEKIEGSFRDPAGFVFRSRKGDVLRQINWSGKDDFDFFVESNLDKELVAKGLIIPFVEASEKPFEAERCYKVIRPEQIPFVSYPYEWSFSQLKEAALKTLELQEIAQAHGMTLKDATPFNFQIYNGEMVHIDSLSWRRGDPDDWRWDPYHQFCDQFVAPLLLAANRDPQLLRPLRTFLEGYPPELMVKLLPWHKILSPNIFLHVYLRAYLGKRVSVGSGSTARPLDRKKAANIQRSLRELVSGLSLASEKTTWSDYYGHEGNNYGHAISEKQAIVLELFESIGARRVCDLGANDGLFSRLVAPFCDLVVSVDSDHACVDRNWRVSRSRGIKNIVPLVLDLFNPSPALGWASSERDSFFERSQFDLVFALALFHHLVIARNIPVDRVFAAFSRICRYLIIEFIPQDDSQVVLMTQNRREPLTDYNVGSFENAAGRYYSILKKSDILGTKRTIYLMERKE